MRCANGATGWTSARLKSTGARIFNPPSRGLRLQFGVAQKKRAKLAPVALADDMAAARVPSASMPINSRLVLKTLTAICPHQGRPIDIRRRNTRDAAATQTITRSASRRRSVGCRGQGLRLLWRRVACHRRERQRNAGLGAGAASCRAHRPPEVRLPRLQQGGASGRAGMVDCWRLGHTGAARPGAGQQVLRSQPALSTIANFHLYWCNCLTRFDLICQRNWVCDANRVHAFAQPS